MSVGPGSAIAAACLTLISVWRFNDGQFGWAAVLLALAIGQLTFGLLRRGPREAGGTDSAEAATAAAHRRGWVRIAVLGVVLSCAAAFWFPPLALVLAALALYSVHRARSLPHPGVR